MITLRDIKPVLARRASLLSQLAMLQRQSPIHTRASDVQIVRNELDRLDNTDLELLIKELK